MPNAKLLIIGDGPARKELEELAYDLDSNNINFLGKVPWQQIPIYYNITDLFVTASRSETQGLTVLEALAASTPVACVNDPSFDVVVDHFNGLKFDTTDELAECFLRAYQDPANLSFLTSNAFESIQDLDISVFIDNALAIYKKVISNHKRCLEVKKMKRKFWRF
jgi:1,2-diacylglycerol 3-alpha-glucosyltransferase